MMSKTIPVSTLFIHFLVVMVLLLASCGDKTETAVAPYMELLDQPYGTDSLQRYDLFLPKGHDQNTRVILLIHGGGWVAGEKEGVNPFAKGFADLGFACVSMNYRLANDSVDFRDMLDDIGSMTGFIPAHASLWGVGKDPLAIFGYSAGGHLALLYSYSRNQDGAIGQVISLAGPTDLQDSVFLGYPDLYAKIKLMAGDTTPSNWTAANPIRFIRASIPPTMLIHGTDDDMVPVSQSQKLFLALSVSSSPYKLLLLKNETHFISPEGTMTFLKETKNFLDVTRK